MFQLWNMNKSITFILFALAFFYGFLVFAIDVFFQFFCSFQVLNALCADGFFSLVGLSLEKIIRMKMK